MSERLTGEEAKFRVLAGFVVVTFLLGGGARADIVSLIVLRPLAVAVAAYALLTIAWTDVTANRRLLALAGATVAVVALQLVPLPPALWQALPGHAILAEIDRAAGLGAVWRPLSLVPAGTWNALFALAVPAAALLLGVQLERASLARLLPVLIGLCIVSGLLGVFQMIGPSHGPLYFYRITNPGSAVGLFSNRNHAAVFLACLAPMLAAWLAADPANRRRLWFASGAVVALAPMIVAAGSRAGLIVGVLGVVAVPLLLRGVRLADVARRDFRRFGAAVLGFVVLISGALAWFARGQTIERLSATDQDQDLRFRAWASVVRAIGDFLPFGSGSGSFVEVFQIYEPDALLKPNYFNHAHNDWLEVALTTGVPGLALLVVAGLMVARRAAQAWAARATAAQAAVLARLGAIVLALMGVASLVDYPLRTPSLAVFAIVAALWLARGGNAPIDSGAEVDIRGGALPRAKSERSKDFHAAG